MERIPWRRMGKIAGWSAGILVGLVVVAAGALYLFVTSASFRSEIERAGQRLYRPQDPHCQHNDRLGLDLECAAGRRRDRQCVVGQGAEHAEGRAGRFDIRLWPLLKGDLVLPRLVLKKPEVTVEVGDKEQLNWSLAEAPATVAVAKAVVEPDTRYQTPLIGKFEVTDGKLTFRDPRRKLELDGTVSTAVGKAGDQPQAELQLKGKLEGQPLALRFVGGSVLMLRDTEQPYPLDLDVTFGATKLKAKGTVQDPFQWTGANVDLTLSGPNLADIYPLLGIPGPPTPPYQISGKLERDPASGSSSTPDGMSATAT